MDADQLRIPSVNRSRFSDDCLKSPDSQEGSESPERPESSPTKQSRLCMIYDVSSEDDEGPWCPWTRRTRRRAEQAGEGARGGRRGAEDYRELGKDGSMLELAGQSKANAKDKDSEIDKRKKAKLVRKLKEQEGLVNANKQVMVRDRRRPRKSIKEMSVLNKRRRVIKNTARKEIAQQKATLESMRHIELKRYSLEARELELFVERIRKVKENKRLTMLFAKFKVTSDSEDSDDSVSPISDQQKHDSKSTSTPAQVDADQSSDSTGDNKKTESMTKLIEELNSMSMLIDYDSNPQWKYITQGNDKEKGIVSIAKKEPEPEPESPSPVKEKSSGPIVFGSRFRRNQSSEAPAELQSINRFPSIINGKASSKDDSELKGYFGSARRCLSQPTVTSSNGHPPRPVLQSMRARKLTHADTVPSMPTLYSDVELSSRENTAEDIKLPTSDQLPLSRVESTNKPPHDYHSNWREREKRGDPLYSPVALSPIQSGLFSPDFVMEEDDLTANYRKKLNPKSYRFQTGVSNSTGDMEFKQAMTKMPSDPKHKKIGYSGTESIIEMQLNSKTKSIADKVQKVRAETMREKPKSMTSKNQATKNIAQMIHQSGDGSRFVEEVKVLRQFAVLCNCKYLRTDPRRLDDRRQAYIDCLMENVAKRVHIRNKWKMGLRKVSLASPQQHTVSLPIIAQGSAE